ncbi:uncharacterized protein LOC128558232 [Mercenaria mercenaria]|uniref:uncharacterized protein LOC128558232 n=1 Tax=Mercenaria mercenaria TaxID=6596 RepID=UPI00234EF998|nr:uncharacterized protein LOC128558232 [Mercenaria mercenaria]
MEISPSSDSLIAYDRTIDESIPNVEQTSPKTVTETECVTKTESLPTSPSSAGDDRTIDESISDADQALPQTVIEMECVTETESLPTSPSSAGDQAPSTVVRKKRLYTGNIILKIDNVGTINFGDSIENVQDVIEELSKGLHIPLSAVMKVDSSEGGLRDNGKDTEKPDKELVKENTGPAKKRGAGEEFAKPFDNSMTQLVVNGFAEYMKSVGALIFNGEVIGTVFRAGDDYVITAFHVIRWIIDPNMNEDYDFTCLEGDNVYINFNTTACWIPRFQYRVRHKISTNDLRLDYTILQITNPAGLPNKLNLDRLHFERLRVNALLGIGYGNPANNSTKVLDPKCLIIPSVTERITDCENWLYAEDGRNYRHYQAAVPNLDIVNNSYRHIDRLQNIFLDISMEHRGSGSPFLTSDGKVVGILTHGHPEFYFHLPAVMQLGFPKDKRFETLLRLEYIYENIVARDPDLANNLF